MDYAENDCKRTVPLQSQWSEHPQTTPLSWGQRVDWPSHGSHKSHGFFWGLQVNKSTSQQVDWPHTDITDSTEFF